LQVLPVQTLHLCWLDLHVFSQQKIV